MNSLPLPSRTAPTPEQLQNFAALNQRTREKMEPQNPTEEDLCNQIVIALWHYRTHNARAMRTEQKVRKIEKNEPNSPRLDDMRQTIAAAKWQARRQKNFAWRRRSEYLAMRDLYANGPVETIDDFALDPGTEVE